MAIVHCEVFVVFILSYVCIYRYIFNGLLLEVTQSVHLDIF